MRDAVSDGLWTAGRIGADGFRATGERIGPAVGGLVVLLFQVVLFLPRLVLRALRATGRFLVANAEAIAAAVGAAVHRLGLVFTPERTLALVAGGAAALLAGSQFADYTGVRIGTPDYAAVAPGAPPPVVSTAKAGSAHAWALLPAAVLAILATIAAVRGRWQLARVVSLVGVAGLAVALLVDRPKGLREGAAGVEYSGANATLLGGFYVEVAASAVLVLTGWMLANRLAVTATPGHRETRRRRSHASAGSIGSTGILEGPG